MLSTENKAKVGRHVGPWKLLPGGPGDASPGELRGRGAHRFSKGPGPQGRQEAPTPPVAAPNPRAQRGGGRGAALETCGDDQPFLHRRWQEGDDLVIRMLSGSPVCALSKRLLHPCYEWRTFEVLETPLGRAQL